MAAAWLHSFTGLSGLFILSLRCVARAVILTAPLFVAAIRTVGFIVTALIVLHTETHRALELEVDVALCEKK